MNEAQNRLPLKGWPTPFLGLPVWTPKCTSHGANVQVYLACTLEDTASEYICFGRCQTWESTEAAAFHCLLLLFFFEEPRGGAKGRDVENGPERLVYSTQPQILHCFMSGANDCPKDHSVCARDLSRV